eukprot:2896732-Pyramimonas_sp.AAC.1
MRRDIIQLKDCEVEEHQQVEVSTINYTSTALRNHFVCFGTFAAGRDALLIFVVSGSSAGVAAGEERSIGCIRRGIALHFQSWRCPLSRNPGKILRQAQTTQMQEAR